MARLAGHSAVKQIKTKVLDRSAQMGCGNPRAQPIEHGQLFVENGKGAFHRSLIADGRGIVRHVCIPTLSACLTARAQAAASATPAAHKDESSRESYLG